MQRLLSQIGRSQRLGVVNLLKRTPGLTVTQMAEHLDMSYMGVKQHCLGLEKDGYLSTARRHRGSGRPELLYQLTAKANDLFPRAENALAVSLLEQSRKLFGAQAPGKMLYLHFQSRTEHYAASVRGESAVERARWLAGQRDKEGHVAIWEEGPPGKIIERHHPLEPLFEIYPEAAVMEREMFQRILGVSVRRDLVRSGGEYECIFFIG